MAGRVPWPRKRTTRRENVSHLLSRSLIPTSAGAQGIGCKLSPEGPPAESGRLRLPQPDVTVLCQRQWTETETKRPGAQILLPLVCGRLLQKTTLDQGLEGRSLQGRAAFQREFWVGVRASGWWEQQHVRGKSQLWPEYRIQGERQGGGVDTELRGM